MILLELFTVPIMLPLALIGVLFWAVFGTKKIDRNLPSAKRNKRKTQQRKRNRRKRR